MGEVRPKVVDMPGAIETHGMHLMIRVDDRGRMYLWAAPWMTADMVRDYIRQIAERAERFVDQESG